MQRFLFIDVDDTLLRERPRAEELDPPPLLDRPLLGLMQEFAAPALDPDTARHRLRKVMDENTWWCWGDFLKVLHIDPATFWAFAQRRQRWSLKPTHHDLAGVLTALRAAGYALVITSNNPVDGIEFKLRMAGLAGMLGQGDFAAIIGTDVARAMKWTPTFWAAALRITGAPAESICVIGDDWDDDVLMPAQVGVSRRILIHHHAPQAIADDARREGVPMTDDWEEVPALVASAWRKPADHVDQIHAKATTSHRSHA